MKYLEFDVKNMAVSRTRGDTAALISGAVGYFGLHFNFDDEFAAIPGIKSVEFSKNRALKRVELADGKCAVPDEFLKDKTAMEIRVVSGGMVATPWVSVSITESGEILPDEPGEEAPAGTAYVKSPSGGDGIAMLRKGEGGLEYSQDGENWNGSVSGVPEVPGTPDGTVYMRAHGDWVPYEAGQSGEENVIEEVQVNGTPLEVKGKAVNIDFSGYVKSTDLDLSIYARTEDIEQEYLTKTDAGTQYAAKADVQGLDTLQGTAQALAALDGDTADTAAVAAKVNEIIGLLQARGVAAQ